MEHTRCSWIRLHALMRMQTPTYPHARTHRPISNAYCFSTATMIRERASLLRYTRTYIACLVKTNFCHLTVLWGGRLVAGLSLRRPGFSPKVGKGKVSRLYTEGILSTGNITSRIHNLGTSVGLHALITVHPWGKYLRCPLNKNLGGPWHLCGRGKESRFFTG